MPATMGVWGLIPSVSKDLSTSSFPEKSNFSKGFVVATLHVLNYKINNNLFGMETYSMKKTNETDLSVRA